MADHADGGQGVSLDEDDREFLERCADHPDDIAVEEIFGRIDVDSADLDEETDVSEVRKLGARGLVQYSQADPAGLAGYGDRILSLLSDDDEDVREGAIMVVKQLVETEVTAFDEPPVEALMARLGKEDQPGSKRVAQTLVTLLTADDPRLTEAVDTTVELFGGDKHEAGSAIQRLAVARSPHPQARAKQVVGWGRLLFLGTGPPAVRDQSPDRDARERRLPHDAGHLRPTLQLQRV